MLINPPSQTRNPNDFLFLLHTEDEYDVYFSINESEYFVERKNRTILYEYSYKACVRWLYVEGHLTTEEYNHIMGYTK